MREASLPLCLGWRALPRQTAASYSAMLGTLGTGDAWRVGP